MKCKVASSSLRFFGPGHPDLPAALRQVGQPVLIGGTLGTASYILVGTSESESLSFGSSYHGAGRQMSRNQALKQWRGREVIDELAGWGILVRSPSASGVAEEAPGAYKDVGAVVDAADAARLSRKVARLEPRICVRRISGTPRSKRRPKVFANDWRTLLGEADRGAALGNGAGVKSAPL
jgi:tRNA-splicing ligase RtcB